jgi:hypothetical protein
MPKIIDSNGGPLIMMERELLPYWGGADNVGGVRPERRDRVTFKSLSDYERASKIRGWIAPLQVHDRPGVVFWGDRLGFGLERENDRVFFAIRPFYEIENLQDHIKFVMENPDIFKKDFEIVISCSNALVFDSAFPGVEIRGDYLEINISPGIYEVLTYEHKTQNAEAVFHKFNLYRNM